MEQEIAELRAAVRGYGEALKSIQTYAAEADVRDAARAALRARPQRLAAAPPAPRFAAGGAAWLRSSPPPRASAPAPPSL